MSAVLHDTPMPADAGKVKIEPQEGPQRMFLETSADIAVYGGQAFGGKSFGLLLDPLRFVRIRGFGAVIFRRNSTDLTQEGGLWDESMKLYPRVGGRPRESAGKLDYRFLPGARISFSHLQHEETVEGKKGGQIAMIGFDELTDFTKRQFFYMLSRNRSQCGVRPYVRATCNPDPDSWVAEFLAWWIDQETGFAIPERSGVIRYMIKVDEDFQWFDTEEEAIAHQLETIAQQRAQGHDTSKMKPNRHKSVTFIAASRHDNPIGMEKDPDYESNLFQLGRVDRARLLEGNWKIRARAGLVFKRENFGVIDLAEWSAMQHEIVRVIRRWDFGGTEVKKATTLKKMSDRILNNPDWTVGLKAVLLKNRDIVIVDMVRARLTPGKVEELVKTCAQNDTRKCTVWIPEDPGQAGKAQVENYQKRVLMGYTVRAERETGSKLSRAEGYAAYVEHGHVKLLRGAWNETFLSEHDAFPTEGVKDDIVDTGSGAYRALTEKHLSTAELMAKRARR